MLKRITLQEKTIKHIIFDFDGVIAETDTARFNLLFNILLRYNINLKDNYTKLDIVGNPTDIFLHNAFPYLNKTQINNIVEERRIEFLNNISKNCIVYTNAIKTVYDLKANGYTIHLATTNDSIIGQKLIEHIGIKDVFETYFFRDDIVNKITKKKDYSLFLTKMKYDPTNIVIIEDSLIGVQSAKDNCIFCIAFNENDDFNLSNLADITIKTYDELRKFFYL